MRQLYWFTCCSQFDSGDYCPYCNRKRKLQFDDSQLLKLLDPESALGEIINSYGSLGALIFRYSAVALIPHLIPLYNSLKRLNYAQLLPKILEAERTIENWHARVTKNNCVTATLTTGEIQQLKQILDEIEILITESVADRVLYSAIKIGILNLINNCVVQPQKI